MNRTPDDAPATADRPLHVLVLPSWYPTPAAPLNGVFFREQAQALCRHGVRVAVAYPELVGPRTLWAEGNFADVAGRFRWTDEDGLPTLRCAGFGTSRGSVVGFAWTYWAQRLVDRYVRDRGRPDVIHAHSAVWPNAAGLAACIASGRHGIPYVVTEHSSAIIDPRTGVDRNLTRRALSRASALVAVSSFLRDRMAGSGGPPVQVVPNLVDTSFFHAGPPRRPGGPFRFLAVAWLQPAKGIDVLLKAFARAFPGDDRVVLEIGGDGPARGALERLAADLGIADRVWFLGALTRAQVREAAWRSDAFVLPSLVETFGVIVIEALSTGLPVVATRCGGPQDVVVPGTGFLVQPGDPKELAAALLRMRAEHARFDPAALRAHAAGRFGEGVVVPRLLDVYRSAIASPRPRRA